MGQFRAFRHVVREATTGRLIADFSGDSEGAMTVVIFDEVGEARANITWPGDDNSPYFFIVDGKQFARSFMKMDSDVQCITGRVGKEDFTLRAWMAPDEKMGFILSAEKEIARVAIATPPTGPELQAYDRFGRPIGKCE